MSISQALKDSLSTIAEIENKIHPMNAPKTTATPYLVYTKSNTDEVYVLQGVTDNHNVIFDINVYSKDVIELETITDKIRLKLLSWFQTTVGDFFIQRVEYSSRDLYEESVDLYRTVIEFEIYI